MSLNSRPFYPFSDSAVALVSTSTWAELQRFKVPTQDMAGVAFSPNGAHVAAWDSPLHNRRGTMPAALAQMTVLYIKP